MRRDGQFGEQALYMLTESYRLTGMVARAQDAFLELERRFPDSALYHKLLGTAYGAEGSYAKALEEFRAAIGKDPSLPEVAFVIGFAHFKQRDYKEAAIWLERDLAIQPCHAKAHYRLGEISVSTCDLPSAERRYLGALSCDDADPSALAGLGAVYTKQQRYEEAISALHKAMELGPDHSEAHYNLAQALLRVGRRTERNLLSKECGRFTLPSMRPPKRQSAALGPCDCRAGRAVPSSEFHSLQALRECGLRSYSASGSSSRLHRG